jgi:hypothetical protein
MLLAAFKLAFGGLGSIERSLKNHKNKGFFNFQRNFIPPSIPARFGGAISRICHRNS